MSETDIPTAGLMPRDEQRMIAVELALREAVRDLGGASAEIDLALSLDDLDADSRARLETTVGHILIHADRIKRQLTAINDEPPVNDTFETTPRPPVVHPPATPRLANHTNGNSSAPVASAAAPATPPLPTTGHGYRLNRQTDDTGNLSSTPVFPRDLEASPPAPAIPPVAPSPAPRPVAAHEAATLPPQPAAAPAPSAQEALPPPPAAAEQSTFETYSKALKAIDKTPEIGATPDICIINDRTISIGGKQFELDPCEVAWVNLLFEHDRFKFLDGMERFKDREGVLKSKLQGALHRVKNWLNQNLDGAVQQQGPSRATTYRINPQLVIADTRPPKRGTPNFLEPVSQK